MGQPRRIVVLTRESVFLQNLEPLWKRSPSQRRNGACEDVMQAHMTWQAPCFTLQEREASNMLGLCQPGARLIQLVRAPREDLSKLNGSHHGLFENMGLGES